MWPIATDVTRNVVCVSVLVTPMYALFKNGWTNRDAVWGLTHGSKEPSFRWGSRWNESICSRDGWEVGYAAFCQIAL